MRILPLLVALLVPKAFAADQPNLELAGIHKIYIDQLGSEQGADLVREKIRLRLIKSARFQVVEAPEEADAVLTGVAGVERRRFSSISSDSAGRVSGVGGTSYAGLGVLRLIVGKTKQTIWIYEYKRGLSLTLSASSRVAEKTVTQLLKDAKAASEQATRIQRP